jgi:hypothetical protein
MLFIRLIFTLTSRQVWPCSSFKYLAVYIAAASGSVVIITLLNFGNVCWLNPALVIALYVEFVALYDHSCMILVEIVPLK